MDSYQSVVTPSFPVPSPLGEEGGVFSFLKSRGRSFLRRCLKIFGLCPLKRGEPRGLESDLCLGDLRLAGEGCGLQRLVFPVEEGKERSLREQLQES